MQNQNMVPDFLLYFDVKSPLFAKINPREISKLLHLWKLVQVKILRHKCSEEVKKLVNTMSSSYRANHKVKNVLLFFDSEIKTSFKKGDAVNNIFQWLLIILIHLAGLYTGAIFNSITKKILPKKCSKKYHKIIRQSNDLSDLWKITLGRFHL